MKDYYHLPTVVLVIITMICVRQGVCQRAQDLVCDSYDKGRGVLEGNETCNSEDHFCVVFWKEVTNEQNESSQIVVAKGCFLVQFNDSCKDDCIQQKYDYTFGGHGFCCCKVDMCNKNFTIRNYTRDGSTVAPTTTTTSTTAEPTRRESDKMVKVGIACLTLAVLAVVMLVVYIYIKYKSECCQTSRLPRDYGFQAINL